MNEARGKIAYITDVATGGELSRAFAYDANGRLLSASGPWGGGSYVYDALSNLHSWSEGGTSGSNAYDAANRVTASTVTGLGSRALYYDDRGNATALGGLGFVYDHANQPVSVSGGVAASYAYDGNFKRVKEVRGGKTIYTIYSRVAGGLIHKDEASDAKTTTYIAAASAAVRLVSTGGGAPVAEYTHADHLGSPVAATNAAGTVTWRESYKPFGAPRLNPAANDNNTGYTGHIEDSATGLVYMQARYYDPLIGRFLSTDPIGYADQLNLYAYVHNDPVNKFDPTGEFGRGSGWDDDKWDKFNRAQQRAANKMERRAERLERRAARRDAAGKPGGDSMRSKAGALRGGVTALRSDGSDGYRANAVDQATYESMDGSPGGGAKIEDDGVTMTVNISNAAAWESGGRQREWNVGHESLHTIAAGRLKDQRGSNGYRAYKNVDLNTESGRKHRAAFDELRGTPTANINPDHIMDEIY